MKTAIAIVLLLAASAAAQTHHLSASYAKAARRALIAERDSDRVSRNSGLITVVQAKQEMRSRVSDAESEIANKTDRKFHGFLAELMNAMVAFQEVEWDLRQRVDGIGVLDGTPCFDQLASILVARVFVKLPKGCTDEEAAAKPTDDSEAEAASWQSKEYCEKDGFVWRSNGCHSK